MLQENLVDFNPFRGILSVSRERDRSNIHVECTVLYFLYMTKLFSFQNNAKNLDPSYMMDLDLWDCLGKVKLILYK